MGRENGNRRTRFLKGRALAAALMTTAAATGLAVVTAQQAMAQEQRRDFSIPAGPLGPALARFGQQAMLQVTYSPSVASGKNTAGVSGSMSPEEAISRLLAGSGLAYSFPNAATVAISAATATVGPEGDSTLLQTITLRGTGLLGPTDGYIASGAYTATKTETPLIEVPQVVNVITRDQIEAQGSQSVTQATRYAPGVVPGFGDSDSRNDVLQSRGFFMRQNLNGSRLPYGAYSSAFLKIEPYGLERIDVLKGPSSVMYGQNLPGGLIDLTTKRPTPDPHREIAVETGNHGRLQGMFDFSGPLGGDERFQYRLTGLSRDADGRIDFGYERRDFIAPAFTWQPNETTSLTVFGHYQRDETISDYVALPAAGTLLPNPNGELPVTLYPGEPGHDGYEREQSSIGYDFRHEFANGWRLRQNLQVNSVDVDTKATPTAFLDPTQRYATRVATRGLAAADTVTIDTNIQGEFTTGGVTHNLLLGFDYLRLKDSYRFASNLYPGQFDLFDPVYGVTPPELIDRIDYRMKRSQVGVYVQDQMRWNDWIVTASLRGDRVRADSSEAMQGAQFSYRDTALTGRIGAVYLMENGFAPFFSYSTSFDPVDGVTPQGGPLKPMEGEQIEAGVKYESADGSRMLSLSTYQITQQNITAPNPDPVQGGFLQTGEARVRGFELEGKAELTPQLSLIASYAYTDSKVTKTNGGTEYLAGNELIMVPDHQAALWLDYGFQAGPLQGLNLAGGVRYMGKSFGDAQNTVEVGGQTLLDAAVSYDFGSRNPRYEGLTLRVTGNNLLDKEYVGYCQSLQQCFYGQGRTLAATLKYQW
ncbi:TonB-dependent siderophore receptor [Paracoccus caeni]|uniref:TonB-dependent siderophore receptor n=1 Tax=Paracoccus caeni TaxID=657651 RepID=A0A934W1S9_9RHOB|nr:TonB-dependent siderophore receptor [Paracoccus caeni]MBK4217683.1 TonB-dependent siderophore receptor [Paracoccus caeni]